MPVVMNSQRIIPISSVPLSSMKNFGILQLIVLVLQPTDFQFWLTLTAFINHILISSRQLFPAQKTLINPPYTTCQTLQTAKYQSKWQAGDHNGALNKRVSYSPKELVQSKIRAKRRVHFVLTFIRRLETQLQMNANVALCLLDL